ncbi:MAG: hypothetical protein GFH27_549283n244 [Chloroflexi bacterium AL-W]|nr:hypothetical protein [Chloroflexi bacterium AL-N1]NOK64636.1 hypothetical protein [Chloroflexi bacterium AL-N10]NOK75877.1 hypothetical protein [Chloroflexi bacterium AL-N5]NOK80365.1 hypothetical protein [Chloroflexi bacterium AL-W]NOK86878.1 hypothetical protein [Chloroflexi bacterium AL-N15]
MISLQHQYSLNNNKVTEFLLVEYQQSISQLQHVYDRLDKEAQYYFGFLGLSITAAGIIAQLSSETITVLAVAQIFSLVLFIAGFRLSRRIVNLTGTAALLATQASMIRRSFVDIDKWASMYIILVTATREKSSHDFTPISRQTSVRILQFFNLSLLIVILLICSFYPYIFLHSVITNNIWVISFTVYLLASLLLGGAFFYHQRRYNIQRGDNYLEKINKSVEEKLQVLQQHKLNIFEKLHK